MASAPASVLPQRPLGRSGHPVSILGLGGDHLVKAGQKEAMRLVREAVDRGITFFDNAWEYGEGRAERWMGQALKESGSRDRITLMTKCCAHLRDYKTAMQQLEDSLSRLRTDHLDLWQFHEIIYDNDVEWLYEHGGLDAALEARDQGKIRWIGFTGHKSTHVHLKLLQRDFPWDAVQMPLNPMDATYRSFERLVLPELVRRGIGVIAMKSMCGGALAQSRLIKPEDALRYCFSLPVSTVVSGMESVALLRKNVKMAANFKSFHAGEMDALRQRAKLVAGDGRFERYKTTQDFDGRLGREAHGFEAPERASQTRRAT
jgi:predicted aldo/keto reductase-like oxidoreductase